MTEKELWKEFCTKKGISVETPYEAWAFCGGGPDADELAELVLNGIKFGTASLLEEYEDSKEEIPQIGDYSVILLSDNEAAFVIRNYDVYEQEFSKVSCFHSYAEGEQRRSLEAWRDIHERFFNMELEASGRKIQDTTPILCEKFAVEYIPDTERVRSLIKPGLRDSIKPGLKEDGLVFIEPTMEYVQEIKNYKEELIASESEFDGCLSLKRMEPKEWVEYSLEWGNPSRQCDEDGVRGTLLMCLRQTDKKVVGMIQIFHSLGSKNATGHIGYSVRPTERRKGYAKWMLKNVLDYCNVLGNDKVLISCEPGNEGSRRTILSVGGNYKDTIKLESKNITLDRYIISNE